MGVNTSEMNCEGEGFDSMPAWLHLDRPDRQSMEFMGFF